MKFEEMTALAQKMVDVAKQRETLTAEEKQILKLLYKSMGGPSKGRKRKGAKKAKATKGTFDRSAAMKKAWAKRRAAAAAAVATPKQEPVKLDKKFPKAKKIVIDPTKQVVAE